MEKQKPRRINDMRMTRTASGTKKITISKKEWEAIGRKAGWTNEDEPERIIDYSGSFPDAISAEGNGNNVLILRKLDRPTKRFDKKLANYELEHRWLNQLCLDENDQAWACVEGNDFTYWTSKELDFERSIFDQVNLWR